MRIIASIVTKNETSRYFQSMLEHNQFWWDDLFVYDDRSTDETVGMAQEFTSNVVVRAEQSPSFLTHEANFRANALSALEQKMNPSPEDWIFAIDADEFLFVKDPLTLKDVVGQAEAQGRTSVDMRIPEIWSIDKYRSLYKRTDGFWDEMSLPRLYKYNQDWSFRNKAMGCGSGPAYTYGNTFVPEYDECHLLHVGYADEADRIAKHNRYTSLPNHGHNPKHIESIIGVPYLVEYNSFSPKLWKGVV